jgi:hypothetical protein
MSMGDALKQWKPPGCARFQILLANSSASQTKC